MASLIKYSYRLSEKKGMVQTAILFLELLLLSAGVVSTFLMLKNSVSPGYLIDMVHGSMRELVNSLKSFLSSPLYIYLFINSIVILILTFSKFQHPILNFLDVLSQIISPPAKPKHHEKEEYMPKRTNSVIAMDTVMSFFSRYHHPLSLEDNQDEMPSVKDIDVDYVQTPSFEDMSPLADASEIKKPNSPLPRHEITNYQNTTKTKSHQTNQEKIVNQYKFEAFNIVEPVMNPEEEEYDTLESTWKAITGGGIKKNKLKKSETCKWPVTPELVSTESIESKDLLPSVAATWKDMRKSLTFNDALSTFRRGGLRGDFSVSTEESNKKFDDFIKKINYERMLQRQESDQRTSNNKLNRAR